MRTHNGASNIHKLACCVSTTLLTTAMSLEEDLFLCHLSFSFFHLSETVSMKAAL